MNQPSKEAWMLLIVLMRKTSVPVILAKEKEEKVSERQGA